MSLPRSVHSALLLTALGASPTLAQAPASPPVRVTTVEGITEYRLANGLRVLLFPDASKAQTTVNMTYLVGSRLEGYGETGMAHLLEHMLFRGSAKHPNTYAEISGHGAEYNGFTDFDRTNFYESFAAADSNLAWAIDLEADRMINSFVAKEGLDKEFSVVRNEYEKDETNVFRTTLKRVLASAYLVHGYKHMPIGSKSDIEHVSIDRLRAFYHTYYQPDDAVLMIAGNFDEKRALALVQEKFGAIPRPARRLESSDVVEPAQDGERSTTVRRAGDVQMLMTYFHIPSGAHPDFPAIDVLSRVMGDGPSSRLYRGLVETKKAAAVMGLDLQQHDPGGLVFLAQLRKQDSMDSAQAAMLSAFEEIATTKPPTVEEVERAKGNMLKDIGMQLNSPKTVGLELSAWEGMGDWRLYFLYRDRLRKVTAQEVQRVAAYYLKPTNRTTGYYIPTANLDRTEIAASPSVDSLVKDYKGETAVAAGEVFDPSPANIESRVQRSTLASGLKLALMPKKTRGQTVSAILDLRFGTEQSLTNRMPAATLTARLLARGTTTLSRQQLADTLDKLKAKLTPQQPWSPGGVRFAIETTRPNLPAVLALVAQVLRTPALDAKEFEQLQRDAIAAVEAQRGEPTILGQYAFAHLTSPYPKGHPRYTGMPDEQIADYKKVTLADVKRFHSDFYGASHGELAVVGDFDTGQLRKEAAALFGGWKSRLPFKPVPAVVAQDRPPEKETLETPDKANAFFFAGESFPMRDDDVDYPALTLANYMFGFAQLNNRLATRLRVKDGLSYAAYSVLEVSSSDRFARLVGGAIYAPQNVDKVESAFFDELNKARSDGFAADEIEKAKAAYLQSRKVARGSDVVIASTLASELDVGRTMMFDADLEQKVAALTPAQINDAFRRRVDPAKMTVVKAGDFAKVKAAGAPHP